MTELRLMDKDEFVPLFLEITRRYSREEIAVLVWEFANGVWKDGYNQGRNDPDFLGDAEDV